VFYRIENIDAETAILKILESISLLQKEGKLS
jgi:hypothetical protein